MISAVGLLFINLLSSIIDLIIKHNSAKHNGI